MTRRDFLRHTASLVLGSRLAGALDQIHFALATNPLTGVSGDLPQQVWQATKNIESMTLGINHGYLWAVSQMSNPLDLPLPTTPKRSHPAWPWLHCVAHCNAVAAASDKQNAVDLSKAAGDWDEAFQADVANKFRRLIYPLFVRNIRDNCATMDDAQRELGVTHRFLFGTDREIERAEKLIRVMRGRTRFGQLRDAKESCLPLIDATESAFQISDFRDNETGRRGGLKYTGSNDDNAVCRHCCEWCASRGIKSDTPEGPGTERPWGPFHVLWPGEGWEGCTVGPVALVELVD